MRLLTLLVEGCTAAFPLSAELASASALAMVVEMQEEGSRSSPM